MKINDKKQFSLNQGKTNPGQYIFDEVYKNALERKKFAHNPKYGYYNALAAMKHRLSSMHDIYNQVFEKSHLNKHMNSFSKQQKQISSQIFQIDKINHSEFKIYRNKQNLWQKKPIPIKDINFDTKYRLRTPQTTRPRLDDIMAQFKRMGKNQNIRKMNKQNRSKLTFSSLNGTAKQFYKNSQHKISIY